MIDVLNSIKKISCKIFYDGLFRGTGILINSLEQKSYCFTAAHVLYGKDLVNPVELNKIKIQVGNTGCYDAKKIRTRNSFDSDDYDILSVEIDFFKIDFSVSITDELQFSEKLIIYTYPTITDNKGTFFHENKLSDSCEKDRFILSIQQKYTEPIKTQSNAALDGISGSGIFYINDCRIYLLGIIIGYKYEEAVFNELDCICLKPFANEVSSKFNYEDPIPNIENIINDIDKLKKKSNITSINKFKYKNHEFVLNLIRKNRNITGKEDVNKEVNNHIESYLYGEALLNWYDEKEYKISSFYKSILESFKRELKQSSKIGRDEVEASQIYEKIRKDYRKQVSKQLEGFTLPPDNLLNLSNHGISSMMAICELDIKNKEVDS
jgi:hypothetical protein